MKRSLQALADRYPDVIEEVRGEGLMLGLKLRVPRPTSPPRPVTQHVLVIPAADNVVRLVPPLIISEEEISEACQRLRARPATHFDVAEAQRGAAE